MATTNQYTPFAISSAVNNMLRKARVSGVNCQCAGTSVVLRGSVTSLKQKNDAVRIARKVCGMGGEINNEIQVIG